MLLLAKDDEAVLSSIWSPRVLHTSSDAGLVEA